MAFDAAGNVYMAGTTGSFDLPVVHAYQSSNRGTPLLFSTDSGVTWQPIANPVNDTSFNPAQVAVDPVNAGTFYTAAGLKVYKTTDGGKTFTSTTLGGTSQSSITGLAVDPKNPKVVYAAVMYSGVWKSLDAGATWTNTSSGLPPERFISSVAVDPHHPQTVWVWASVGAYVSTDGAATWSASTLTFGGGLSGTAIGLFFDAVTPGVIYGPGLNGQNFGFLRSTDGGASWTPLNSPFSGLTLTPDPVRAGYLYTVAAASGSDFPLFFYRSRDYGTTWEKSDVSFSGSTTVAVDPTNTNTLIAGPLRSVDGGQTWIRNAASRSLAAVFSPVTKGLVFAAASATNDALLVKYAPDGKTVQFATYFGGMGDESATAVTLDSAGNVWLAGNTTSADLPVTAGAVQSALAGTNDMFLARFNTDGKLDYCTYLGGTTGEGVTGIAVDPNGSVWITGSTSSTDFPIVGGSATPWNPSITPIRAVVAKLDPGSSTLKFSSYIGGTGIDSPGNIAVDASGNVILTGTTTSPDFPLVGNAFTNGVGTPSQGGSRTYLVKLDSTGKTVFSTYFGGTTPAKTVDYSAADQFGIAVAADQAGNIVVTGTTSMTDFPVTPGAYQTKFSGGCPYPAYSIYTGMIGTIYRYIEDDVFLTKLSPDGKTILYSTFLGGRCYDRPTSLTLGADGTAYIAGETNSDNFPLVGVVENGPAPPAYKSFVSAIDASGSQLKFSSYLSAGSNPAIAVSADSKLRVGGTTGFLAQSSQTGGTSILGPQYPNADNVLYTIDLTAPIAPIQLTGVMNGFSLQSGNIAPGEIIVLTVPNLPSGVQGDVGLAGLAQLSTSLAGVQVFFDGKAVPVMSVGAGRIFAIAPANLAPSTMTTIRVHVNEADSNEMAVPVVQSAPALLSLDGSGAGRANARNADGSQNGPDNPAARGTQLTLFFTGGSTTATSIDTWFGPAQVAPLTGFVPGIYSARVTVPTDAYVHDSTSFAISSGDVTSPALVVYIK